MRSVELYLDTAGKSVVAYQLKFPDKKIEGSCEVQANGNLICEGINEEIKVEVKEQTGKSGTIVFQEGKIIKVIKLVIGDYEYNMDESEKIIEKEYEEQIVEETPLRCFDYEEKEDGTVAITGYNCGGYYEQEEKYMSGDYYIGNGALVEGEIMDVVIPSKINGKVVTELSANCFSPGMGYGNERLRVINNVQIPYSVTTIGESAFHYSNLSSVEIPDSVTSIGSYAFSENQLTSITIPSCVTEIEKGTFSFNSLESIIIPDSVASIGESAFRKNLLTSLTIGNSVTAIGDCAFQNNILKSIIIPDSVESIGLAAFFQNFAESLVIGKGIKSVSSNAFQYNRFKSVKIDVPKSQLDFKTDYTFWAYGYNDSNIEWASE